MAESKLTPLQFNVPIVNDDGTPTPYLIQLLQQLYEEKAITDAAVGNDIIAGAGLSGGGSLDAGPVTLSASVQAILNLVSTTRGAILYRGAAVWSALLPGAAGQFLKTQGVGADPIWDAAGGGGGSSFEIARTLPRLANFTFNNGGLALTGITNTDKTYALLHQRGTTAVGQHSVLEYNTAPNSAAFTLTARFGLYSSRYGGGYQSCLYLRNSSNNRMLVFGDYNINTQPLVQIWSGYNGGFAGDTISRPSLYGWNSEFPWRRIILAAGTLDFQHSCDGECWYSLGTTTLAAYLTAAGGVVDKVGFGCFSNDNGAVCQSFTLTTP